jgi:hypothetical protein
MSACEVTTLSGFVSKVNRMRIELDCAFLDGFRVDHFVKNTTNGRMGKIHRFCVSEGVNKADVRYWRKNPNSPNRKLLSMVCLFELEKLRGDHGQLCYLRKLHTLPRNGL